MASAKDYAIRDVRIDARVDADGTLAVDETREFEFDGDFSRVYWVLEKARSEGIEVTGASGPDGTLTLTSDPVARPPGTYAVTDQGDSVLVELFFRLGDQRARFGIQYRALGAAKRWDDTGELYWQLVGSDWGVDTDALQADVTVPDVTRDQVRAWAHGPLWGEVTIGPDGVVHLEVDDLPGRHLRARSASSSRVGDPRRPRRCRATGSRRSWPRRSSRADEANQQRTEARVRQIAVIVVGLVDPADRPRPLRLVVPPVRPRAAHCGSRRSTFATSPIPSWLPRSSARSSDGRGEERRRRRRRFSIWRTAG